MAVDVSKLVISEIAQITAFNNAGELEFILDEVQEGSISNSQEKTDITGRNGRKIASLKKNKAVTVSATNGLLSGGLLAAQTGTEIEQGEFNVRITDVVTVTSNKATISKEAVGTIGNEIGVVYIKNANGSLGDKFEQNSEVGDKKFKYNTETKEIEFAEGTITDGTEIVAFYDVKTTSAKIANDSEKYSKVLKLYVDVSLIDSCDVEYFGQLIIQRADVSGEFEMPLGGDNFAHSFEAESLAGGCSGSTNLWDLIVYGA